MPILLRQRIKTARNLLLHSETVQRFIKLFSVDVLVRTSSFLLLPVYLRLMSQSEFGVYGYLFTAIGLFASLLNLGLYVSQTKLWFKPEINRGDLVFTINVLYWGVTILTLIILSISGLDNVLLNLLFKQDIQIAPYRGAIYLGICASLISLFFQNHLTNSELTTTLQRYNFTKILAIHTLSLAALLVWRQNTSGVRLYAQYLAELVINIVFLHTYIRYFSFTFDKSLVIPILRLGIPVFGSSIAGLFYNFMDRFLLEKYVSLSELGVYNLGMTLGSVVLLILMSFYTLYMPQFLKISSIVESVFTSKRVLRRLILVLVSVGIAIWFGTWFALTVGIIQVKYDSVLHFLPILLVSYLFQSINVILVLFYVKFDDTRYALFTSLILALISTVLNTLLIPIWGNMGASIAGAISHGLCVFVNLFFIRMLLHSKSDVETI
ncbi:MAG: oligosaccharide flippase family protein [Bacteroidia bacterium]|nr:oligosaccharide flippase family protein [Bacteroidia bacterium]